MKNSTINTNYNSPITMNKQFIPMDQRAPAKIFNKNDNIKKKMKKKVVIILFFYQHKLLYLKIYKNINLLLVEIN